MAKVKYTPDVRGLRDAGRSSAVQAVAVAAAEKMASWARADDPDGGYAAGPATVMAGWQNEARAGAHVVETAQGMGGVRRTLARAAAQFGTSDPNRRVKYTTRSGKTISATQAQVDHWTRGRRS